MNRTWVLFRNEAYLVSSRIPANLAYVTVDGTNFDYIFVCYDTDDVDEFGERKFVFRAVPMSEKKDILRRFPNALGIDRLR